MQTDVCISSSGLSPTQYQYTGQYSHTADFGLMFYNARWYDPSLGRFAQADSIVPPGVQGLDRYAYVNNNPMSYIDPDGHFAILATMAIGAIAGAAAGAIIYASTSRLSGREMNATDLGAAVAVGAIGGLLIGTGVGAASGVAAFAAIGAGTGVIGGELGYAAISGKGYDSGDMIISAAVSGAAGAATGAVSGAIGLSVAGAPSWAVAEAGTKAMITNSAINGTASVAQYELTQKYHGEDPTWGGRGTAFASGATTSLLMDGITGGAVTSPSVNRMVASTRPNFNMWVGGRPSGMSGLLLKDTFSQFFRSAISDFSSRRLEPLFQPQ